MTRTHRRISSSLLGNFYALVTLALALQGCGDEAGKQSTCENLDAPDLLVVTDVTPSEGSSVENDALVHAFTVVAASGTFETLTLGYGTNHDAGAPDPLPLKFEPRPSGPDMVYTFAPVVWEEPGHVELIETGQYSDGKRCYILPRPLFSYDVTE